MKNGETTMECIIREWKIEDAKELAELFSYNTASCRVLEKAGFAFEGLLRSNAVKNGEVIDMKMYSLIKGEW